jgi:hypothetical protein
MASLPVMQLDWLDPVWFSAAAVLAACMLTVYRWAKAKPKVYVVDFAVLNPPDK